MMTASGEGRKEGGTTLQCTIKGVSVQMIAEDNVYQLA